MSAISCGSSHLGPGLDTSRNRCRFVFHFSRFALCQLVLAGDFVCAARVPGVCFCLVELFPAETNLFSFAVFNCGRGDQCVVNIDKRVLEWVEAVSVSGVLHDDWCVDSFHRRHGDNSTRV